MLRQIEDTSAVPAVALQELGFPFCLPFLFLESLDCRNSFPLFLLLLPGPVPLVLLGPFGCSDCFLFLLFCLLGGVLSFLLLSLRLLCGCNVLSLLLGGFSVLLSLGGLSGPLALIGLPLVGQDNLKRGKSGVSE